ncbi:NAD(P)/FAD-dependent oxidoreductase [Collinsella sp. D33t1_170424_A12]|uniref:NAD(P)/FAD-dependent oxidoreductase n=1 Tax=Collinsella sp. D33t1_170424_A12 TaxID=2787135 RepID=UPI00189A47C8|nr:NAD(P)/FAD-dependent oxidoreductase [Collinsella sp. D33t1_170424_A12]
MESQAYPMLFSPIKVGTQEVKNRVFMPPVSTNLADHGYVTDALIDHYTARAKGGVGLIITEVVTVEPTYTYLPGDMCCYDDTFIPGWEKLAAAVHQYGAKIMPQLFHPAYMAFNVPGTPRLIAPSFVGPSYAREAPRPITIDEIHELTRQFGDAAERMQKAGVDGVEVHAAHAHGMLGGFLSPQYNKRTDEYGGSLDARMRFLLEVIAEIRERCGKDFIIDVRISGDEYTDGGLTLNDMIYVSRRLEKSGVDMIHVSGGTTIKRGSAIPAAGTKQASHAALSREIKKHVSIPVATVGRINEAWIAEELIEDGAADICMMGRANLCDAEFCNKAAAGRAEEVRPCIGCLRCLNGIMFGRPISCTVNPDVEHDEAGFEPAAEKKDVLVVGAGPAGMEAAFIAARRGHHVVLVDKQEEPGGQLRIASVPPAKQELTRVIKYQFSRLAEAGVDVRMGVELTAEDIQRDFAGYEVVLAYGAEPIVPGFMTGFKQVMTADDLLAGRAFPGKKIVIVGGGSVGCETADYLAPLVNDLAPSNRDVTLIEMTKTLAANEGGAGRAVLVTRILDKGVHVLTEAKLTGVTEDAISYEKDGEEHVIEGADTLVLALGYRPNTVLADTLAEAGFTCHVLGDSRQCGNLRDAIEAGYEAACAL